MTRSRVLLGLVFATTGVILLLDRIGGIHRAAVIVKQWWPLAIVMIGAANLLRLVRRPWSFWGPVLLMAVGAALLLVTIHPVPRVVRMAMGLFWPMVLVAAGLAIALFRLPSNDSYEHFIRQSAVLRERRVACRAKALRYGRARAFLGHLELDLRNAHFRDNQANLDVTAICGHVDVVVPPSYEVDLKPPVGICVRATEPTGAVSLNSDESARLIVHVLAFFGRANVMRLQAADYGFGPRSG
jgi:LiaF transmembrane domain